MRNTLRFGIRIPKRLISTMYLLGVFSGVYSQQLTLPNSQNTKSEKLEKATLETIIQYAVAHQSQIQQAIIDQEITNNSIKSKLADWYPQVNAGYNLQHNFAVQTSIIGGNPVKLGVDNTSALQFGFTQNIFNRDVLLANRTQQDVKLQSAQALSNLKISLIANVSKAFYAVLATQQQIKVAEGDIIRLRKSLKDAKSNYDAGTSDKIDYKRVSIALNNAQATKTSNEELLKARLQNLKTLMGYPEQEIFSLDYNAEAMEQSILIDSTVNLNVTNRIEYQQLLTIKRLRESDLQYNKWSFLPSISLNGVYNLNYLNNSFVDLYSRNYPNSYTALTLSLPIFQGGKRKYNLSNAGLQLKRLEWDMTNLDLNVKAEYQQALSTYKSNLATYLSQKENVELAKEVYDLVSLQYKSGIKTFLEVITSETDLRTARINYYNAMYAVLSSKVDVQKALGQIEK